MVDQVAAAFGTLKAKTEDLRFGVGLIQEFGNSLVWPQLPLECTRAVGRDRPANLGCNTCRHMCRPGLGTGGTGPPQHPLACLRARTECGSC